MPCLPVDFHGDVSDRGALARALSAADVAVAPSVAETFGLSILEAMACPSRRAAARDRAERFPWSSTIDAMLALHRTTRV